MPAQSLAQGLGCRHTDHGGNGKPHAHHRHGKALLARWGHRGRRQISYGEVCAVRQTSNEARHQQDAVIRGQGCQQVTHEQEGDEQDDEAAAWELSGERRDDGRAHDDAQRINRNNYRRRVFRNAEIIRDERQQAHRGELRGTDGKSAQRHGDHDDGAARRGDFRLARDGAALDTGILCFHVGRP